MDMISFREAKTSDAAAIGALHVASWRETYKGLIPDQLLNELSAEARSAMWSSVLNNRTIDGVAVFVAQSGRELVGFGACGGQRNNALKEQGFDGEIGAIYVLKLYQRFGVGSALMGLLARRLLEQGRRAASLWVLRENLTARAFYQHIGGSLLGERVNELSGGALVEVAYGWRNLASVAR